MRVGRESTSAFRSERRYSGSIGSLQVGIVPGAEALCLRADIGKKLAGAPARPLRAPANSETRRDRSLDLGRVARPGRRCLQGQNLISVATEMADLYPRCRLSRDPVA
jgi:hypothetical protein